MEKVLKELNSGTVVDFCGYNWVAIHQEDDTAVLLMKDILENRAFDVSERPDWNNWIGSTVREYLNTDFIKKLDESVLLEYESDLTSDDGLNYYGKSKDKVFLISCDFYRKHRDFIPNADYWWWTITPWTIWRDDYSSSTGVYVLYVSSSGAVGNYDAYYGSLGLRPACLVSSSLKVNVVED